MSGDRSVREVIMRALARGEPVGAIRRLAPVRAAPRAFELVLAELANRGWLIGSDDDARATDIGVCRMLPIAVLGVLRDWRNPDEDCKVMSPMQSMESRGSLISANDDRAGRAAGCWERVEGSMRVRLTAKGRKIRAMLHAEVTE